jgi:hypothetical protein
VAQFDDREALEVLAKTVRSDDEHAVTHAARTLQLLGEKARPVLPAMREAVAKVENAKDCTYRCLQPAINRLAGTVAAGAAVDHAPRKARPQRRLKQGS